MSIQIYSVRWEIGAHLPFNKEINTSLLDAIQQGMYALQIFMGNPKSFTRQPIHEEDIRICQTLIKKYPTNIFTHFPYTSNLAGKSKKDGLAWNNNSVVDRNLNITLKGLEYELSVVARIGKGVVIHPIGVCVDTAHIWGQGDYDLRKVEEVERLFQDFDEEIGIDNFKLLHLNDSSVELGSKKDRHAHIATGKIWSQDQKSLIWLLDKCTYYKIPIILETGGACMYTLSLLDFE